VSDAGTPGWYPDPFRRFELRYFNGQRWTGDVSTHGNRMIDPVAAMAPAAPFAAPYSVGGRTPAIEQGWTQPWSGGYAQAPKPKRGKAIAAFVLAVSAAATGWFPFVFALAAIAAGLALIFGFGGLREAKAQDGAGHGFAVAALIISPIALAICVGGFFFTRFVVHEINLYDHPGEYTLPAPAATTNATTTTCAGTIRNDSTDTRSYELTISYGQDGVKLASDIVDVSDVGPGDVANWSDAERITQSGTITCSVTTVRGPAPFGIRPDN
jgi:hypothetical protein